MEEEDAAAEHIVSQRIAVKTKANYRGKINNIVLYLLSTPPLGQHVDANNQLVVPLPSTVIKKIFGWLSTNTDLPKKRGAYIRQEVDDLDDIDANEDVNVDVFANNKVTISHSCMQGYKSALQWYYWENGKLTIDNDTNMWANKFIEGYKKTIAEKKAKGIMSITEGRSSLSYSGYNAICHAMMTMQPIGRRFTFSEGLFAWPYMILSWNLMSRCGNIAGIMLEHMDWCNDAMVITFAKHKGEQTGEGLGNLKHVYGNPLNPKVCPILSLAVMMFSTHRPVSARTHQLFEGMHSDDRFVKILQIIINSLPEDVLGACRKDIGIHSNRKGSVSFVLAFCYVTAVQVYLRAGWSLGNTQDRYVFAGPGGDQLVGRAVSGLPINDKAFATLPPHFATSYLNELSEIGWNNILEGYDDYPAGFRRIIPFLFASIVFHEEFLRKELSEMHPLWNQRVFTKIYQGVTIVDTMKGRVLTGTGCCASSTMVATGIPSHLAIAHELSELKQELTKLKESHERDMKASVDTMVSKMDMLPDRLRECLIQHFIVDGVAPVNVADIQRMIASSQEMIMAQIREAMALSSRTGDVTAPGETGRVPNSSALNFRVFYWKGRFRCVPEGFEFPSTDVKTMWDPWHYGHAGLEIQPYKNLMNGHASDLVTDLEKVNLSRASKVMKKIYEIAVAKGYLEEGVNVSELPREDSDRVIDKAYTLLLGELYENDQHRPGAKMVNTVANRLSKRMREE